MHSTFSPLRPQRIIALTSVMVALLISLGILRWALQGDGAGGVGAMAVILEVELEDGLDESDPEVPGLCLPTADPVVPALSQPLEFSDLGLLPILGGPTCRLHPERAPPAI